MKILKDSFEEEFEKIADNLAREHYTTENNQMESYTLRFETKFTNIVDIKDELANVEIGTMLKTPAGKITLGEQIIEFISKNGKTLKPVIGKYEVTGSLKKKLLATMGFGKDTETVEMWGKYFTKQTFQYGSLAVAYYMEDWQMNRGFFMRVKTSKINRTTRKRQYDGQRFAYKEEEEILYNIELEEEIDRLETENIELRERIEELESH